MRVTQDTVETGTGTIPVLVRVSDHYASVEVAGTLPSGAGDAQLSSSQH